MQSTLFYSIHFWRTTLFHANGQIDKHKIQGGLVSWFRCQDRYVLRPYYPSSKSGTFYQGTDYF